jgi:hypothetical protein
MSFIQGLQKTAKAAPSEAAEYEKYGKIERAVRALPSPDPKPGAKDVKEGTEVCYTSETDWKRGPRGSHTKSCSVDKEQEPMKNAYREELERHGVKGFGTYEQVNKKYPGHHSGEWKDEAVHIGDTGVVTRVEQSKSKPNKFHVRWDKHDCEWGYYYPSDLKLIKKKTSKSKA